MSPLLIAAPIALLLLLRKRSSSSSDDASAASSSTPTTKEEVAKLVAESKEIVQGKRDAYSDDPETKVTPTEAANRVKDALTSSSSSASTSSSSSDAEALRAAQVAASSSSSSSSTKPVTAGKPVVNATTALRPPINFATTTAPKPKPKPVVKPQPVVVVQPKPQPAQPTGPQPPPGYDRAKAAAAAPALAKHIAAKKYDYSRPTLKAWQLVAGIDQDGVYGRGSAAALRFYVGASAPKALFAKGVDHYPWGTK